MAIRSRAKRIGDMHPARALQIVEESDGDITVCIMQDGSVIRDTDICRDESAEASVQFCVSGGRSPRVRAALMGLLVAMELENSERPIG